MDSFSKICRDIKSIKIQGASNVARAAVKAYSLKPTKKSKEILIKLRPTEPMVLNSLNILEKSSAERVLNHFDNAQEFINYYIHKLIPSKAVIFTHCHSNTLAKALISAHKSGKKFSVILTETRPLYQGHITAKQLLKAGIKVSLLIDSAMNEGIKKSDLILLGADAVTKKGVFNKIGSALISKISKDYKKPLYIVTDSWKISLNKIQIEKRSPKEIWNHFPKKVKIENFSFELIPPNQITKVVSEFGIIPYKKFIKESKKGLKNYGSL
ncbi:hypothetical protein J4416_00980 [Candidatus Pacearchaeota archaeon]|uniref:R15P Isomerase n=1 Tax=uncultured Candidatus Pacearchaeota archaeon TaxID=2109283 RepID=A0A447IU76_9ARCH|nr:hypothetical protein [Candidatus Pacearchaeota archaeon]VDS11078.1 R15P Isomerase [uncultured Candidatus Pacearchaeota archaeon]